MGAPLESGVPDVPVVPLESGVAEAPAATGAPPESGVPAAAVGNAALVATAVAPSVAADCATGPVSSGGARRPTTP
jgi:hypothetical protein